METNESHGSVDPENSGLRWGIGRSRTGAVSWSAASASPTFRASGGSSMI